MDTSREPIRGLWSKNLFVGCGAFMFLRGTSSDPVHHVGLQQTRVWFVEMIHPVHFLILLHYPYLEYAARKMCPPHSPSLSSCCAVTQRAPLRIPTTARCLQPGETSWPRSDRGSWPTPFTTSGRRERTSSLSDTSTPVSGKAVRNTATVRTTSTRPVTQTHLQLVTFLMMLLHNF